MLRPTRQHIRCRRRPEFSHDAMKFCVNHPIGRSSPSSFRNTHSDPKIDYWFADKQATSPSYKYLFLKRIHIRIYERCAKQGFKYLSPSSRVNKYHNSALILNSSTWSESCDEAFWKTPINMTRSFSPNEREWDFRLPRKLVLLFCLLNMTVTCGSRKSKKKMFEKDFRVDMKHFGGWAMWKRSHKTRMA